MPIGNAGYHGNRFMKYFLILLLSVWSGLAHASCHKTVFANPDQIEVNSDSVLIVTHATTVFDPRFSSKRGVDEAISYARVKGIPIIYLQDNSPEQSYFMDDCKPDFRAFSSDGEVSFEIRPSKVYVVGGHLEQCLYNTVTDVLSSWAKQSSRNLTLTFLMDGIYSNGDLIRDTDYYRRDYGLYMRAQTHRYREDDPWPKITLLDSLGIINQEDNEIEYLRRTLPDYTSIMPEEYRVELKLNNVPAVQLQEAPEDVAPTLQFNFVDSVSRLESS